MSTKARQFLTGLLVTVGTVGLAACGSADGTGQASFEEPFSFAEVRRLSLPAGATNTASDPATISRLRLAGPRIAELYGDALSRFESIYGDGVGPAKGTPEYLGCRAAFHQVEAWVGKLPIEASDAALGTLWSSLKRCRDVAGDWAGPAEMATFGNDLLAMTDGAMLVLGYAATASEISLGQQIYREAIGSDARTKSKT